MAKGLQGYDRKERSCYDADGKGWGQRVGTARRTGARCSHLSIAGNGRVVKKNLLLARYPFERLSKSFKRGELQRGWGEKVTTRTNRASARRKPPRPRHPRSPTPRAHHRATQRPPPRSQEATTAGHPPSPGSGCTCSLRRKGCSGKRPGSPALLRLIARLARPWTPPPAHLPKKSEP